MVTGWKQTSARGNNRVGNNPYKYMLESLGFKNTDTKVLKEWIVKRSKRVIAENDLVTVILSDKVFQAKTIAEACWIMRTKYGIK